MRTMSDKAADETSQLNGSHPFSGGKNTKKTRIIRSSPLFNLSRNDQDPIKFCGWQIVGSLTTSQADLLNQGTGRLNSLVFKEQH